MLAQVPVEQITFMIAGAICLSGCLGVVLFKNPVHNALSLVATLFGVAVLFISQEAYFLAAVQVIVYAGAVVVLFLFVIMLLGVDKVQSLASERDPLFLTVAGCLGGAFATMLMVAALWDSPGATGARSVTAQLDPENDLRSIAEVLFTDYVFAFEITSLLLTIAVIGAAVLARRPSGGVIDLDEFPPPVTELEQAPESDETAEPEDVDATDEAEEATS